MLQRLVLDHFRNYEHQELEFAQGVNALIGANGQGKTNVLEAICYLSLLRSFRTSKLPALVHSGTGNFTLFGEVRNAEGTVTRLGVTHGQERRLMLNGQPVHRSSDFISRLVCVPFLPEDLSIVKGAPSGRRRFLDIALCQTSPQYLRTLQEYNEALKSRNAMLKTPGRYPHGVVTAYDAMMAERAVFLETERHRLAERLNDVVLRQSAVFFPDGRRLAVRFLSGISRLLEPIPEDPAELSEKYLSALEKGYEYDCREGATHYGPHHSELACTLEGKMLSLYGSEGECRTAAIALRLAMLEVLREEHGADDITILVDDVLGELDSTRRRAFLLQIASAAQVIFAGTALPSEFPQDTRVFTVERGTARSS